MKEEVLPEIWGGIECTINRVENKYLDQLELAGFYSRPDYLDAIANLGIKTMRFPILWERHQSDNNGKIDWEWVTSQLITLKDNGIEPVAGLLHHGSGPAYTDLLHPEFPEKFAAYAAQVALTFPWITYYTPINEPLTTARFSGLYGFWYPHKNNDVSFIKILLNELKATVLAMREIRKINPFAKLVQTEDLGKTYSTPLLHYQAAFENERRWLTFDILTGKFNSGHALWNYFIRLGIEPDTMQFFIDNPCVPDIMGANHYITSERYLDEDVHKYHPATQGGNTLHSYADVEAVRVKINEPCGARVLLKELWERYKVPMAITEVHLHCSREEQLRWIKYMYNITADLKAEGVNVVAITVWALLGSFGWNKLLTCFPCEYETGAFDISAGYARPTAIAALIKELVNNSEHKTPLPQQPGWWERSNRLFVTDKSRQIIQHPMGTTRPLVIIGKNGTLGKAFITACNQRHIYYVSPGRKEVDICNSASLEKMILEHNPWAIINAAGFIDVDGAETDHHGCNIVNTLGPQKLAILCEKYKVKLVCFSSDLVFDGTKNTPYVESDKPNALNVYGRSKVFAEEFLANVNPSSLMIRTSTFFTETNPSDIISKALRQLQNGYPVTAYSDLIISPTYVPHLTEACLNLLIDDAGGVWHLANKGSISWYDFVCAAATTAGYNESTIIPVASPGPAKRPLYAVLGSEKYSLMPSLEEGLREYFSKQYVPV